MKFIKGFDGLRGISILFVLLSHLGIHNGFMNNSFYKNRVFDLFSGSAGVNVFFVLSGFLITRILLNEKEKTGKIAVIKFIKKRALRLYPVLILFIGSAAILMQMGLIPGSRFGLFYSVVYLYNFIPNAYYTSELGHMWSLAVEEQFYLFWPFLVLLIDKRRLPYFVIFFIALSLLFLNILPKSDLTVLDSYFFNRWFFPSSLPIFVGSLSALILSFEWTNFDRFLKKNIFLWNSLTVISYFSTLWMPLYLIKLCFLFQSVGVAMFLIWITSNQYSYAVKCLEIKPLAYLGKISYGIYIYQGLFLTTGPKDNILIQSYPINICLTILISILSFHFYESYFLKLKNKL